MEILFVFIIGLFIGSFLNVLADRLPKGESVIKGRSHCDNCKKNLAWYDLIPLLSFILLKGKCRYCHTRLSPYYPIVELTTGFLFMAVLLFVLGWNINFISIISVITVIYYLFIVSVLIVIFFSDLKYGIIPDKVLLPAILVSLFFSLATFEVGVLNHLLSAVGASLFFLFLFLVTRGRGMGFGDVKFAFLIGLILGFPSIIVGLYVAFLTGAFVGIILILWRKRKLREAIPFGPFLVLGTLFTLFFGERLLDLLLLNFLL